MSPTGFPWVPLAALLGFLAGGVYLVEVLDRWVAARTAGERSRPSELLLGPLRDGALLLLQQRTRTERPDAETWAVAPALLAALGAAALAAVPLAPGLAVADLGEGIVLFGAAMALVMVAVFLHGWSPNSAFPLVGGYRFIALALSYEMPLALVLIGTALPAESLSVGRIVESQAGLWNVVRQPLGLPLYLVPGLGLAFWGPLRFPDAEDLSGGSRLEASGIALLAWELARRIVLVAAAAMGAAAFLGGWLGPVLPGALWMAIKTGALLSILVFVGHRFGRIRLERFVVVAWAVLIPLALVDVFAAGALALLAK